MKITISSSGGTLRTRPLAYRLEERGYLRQFYTPYYNQKDLYLARFLGRSKPLQKIPTSKVRTNTAIFLLEQFLGRTHLNRISKLDTRFLFLDFFDRYVSKNIDNSSDIVFAESAMALHTIKRAKKLGIITILDRTNSHIQHQTELVKAEYERLGIKYAINTPSIIEKNLQEYDEADYIAVLSSFAKKTFIEKGIPEEKLLLIPSGVDLTHFKQIKKKDNVFRIIYCGVRCIKKGVHYLIEAFKDLSLKNAELMLIGGIRDDMKWILKKYEGIYNVVEPVPRNELNTYFSQGSVFVLPSLEEGLAKVVIEAMACGLPVIATTNTGAADVIRDSVDGFIVPIKDIQALKEKILYMYEHQDICRQMGRKAKERIQSGFTEEDYANRFIQACKMIFDKKSKRQDLKE